MTRAARASRYVSERGSQRTDGARAACDALRKGGKKAARVAQKAQNLWHLSLLRIVRDAKRALLFLSLSPSPKMSSVFGAVTY